MRHRSQAWRTALLATGLALAAWLAPAARAFDYDEAIDGDIPSFDENAPTPLGTLDPGTNRVEGSWNAELEFGDVFSVLVPAGFQLRSVTLTISGFTGEFSGGAKLFATTPVFTSLDFGSFLGDGVFRSVVTPLAAPGPYGFTTTAVGGTMPPARYDWSWKIVAPEPHAGVGALAAVGSLAAVARARGRRRPAHQGCTRTGSCE